MSCDYELEGYCTNQDINCQFAKGEVPKECTATEDDLVDGCIACESAEADAKFPYDSYCKKCAKDAIEELELKQKEVEETDKRLNEQMKDLIKTGKLKKEDIV